MSIAKLGVIERRDEQRDVKNWSLLPKITYYLFLKITTFEVLVDACMPQMIFWILYITSLNLTSKTFCWEKCDTYKKTYIFGRIGDCCFYLFIKNIYSHVFSQAYWYQSEKKRPTGDFSGNNAPDNGLNPPQNKSSWGEDSFRALKMIQQIHKRSWKCGYR